MKPDFKKRRSGRTSVAGRTRLRAPGWYVIEVTIRDVSTSGFQAQCPETVRIGSYVSLDVPGIGPVNAQVRWQLGDRMGGMFLDPISLNRCEWTAVPVEPPKEAA
ncbi:MAG: PilZ domain-containing protein [Allosphingosinicella sp.]